MNATFDIADSAVGKRYSTPICAVCCGDDYCNSYACETVKRELQERPDFVSAVDRLVRVNKYEAKM